MSPTSSVAPGSHPDIGEIKLHILGTEGAFIVSEARPEVSIYYRDQPASEFRNIRIENENSFLLADDLANAIDSGNTTILDARAGRDICAIVEACVRSGRTGRLEAVNNEGKG